MDFTFERNINYYETDKMGVVHHSNYIRFLEEARCYWLQSIEMPFDLLEDNGITIPVLGVNCTYKYHVTFGDTIIIKPYVKEYSGVRMTVGYEIADKKNGKIVLTGETKHCFTDKNLKPINLKKYNKEFNDKFESLLKNRKRVKNMEEIRLNVNGMVCGGCEKRVVNSLSTIDGVKEVIANHNEGTVAIKSDEKIDRNIIKEKIEDLGFEVKED